VAFAQVQHTIKLLSIEPVCDKNDMSARFDDVRSKSELGQIERFPLRRLGARSRLGERTFAGPHDNGQDAPNPGAAQRAAGVGLDAAARLGLAPSRN
jgi:hypothetical protein